MKTRVAILLLSPGKAGVESVIFNLFRSFASDRAELWLVSSSEIAPYFRGVVPKERHLILGPCFQEPTQRHLRYIKRYLSHKFDLKKKKLNRLAVRTLKFLEQNQIRTIHANLVWDYYIATEIKRLQPGIRYVNTMHGTLSLDPSDNYFPFFERREILRMLSNADAFTSACQYFFDLLAMWNVPVRQSYLIPNGVDPDVYPTLTRPASSGVTLCFMGGGRPDQKGGDILVHALYLLVNHYHQTDLRLLVYGYVPENGKERELALQMKLEQYIEWRGFVEPPGHLRGMAEADIFVLPSRHEGVANTLMEAMGAAKPIVASRVGGTPEVVTDELNGLLCYPDAHDLAEKLFRLIGDEALRNSMAEANRALAQNYRWDNLVRQYESVYLAKNP